MGVPACLWRRTGEIYKGNREFTELVGVDGYMMRDVRIGLFSSSADEGFMITFADMYSNRFLGSPVHLRAYG
jgi:hypothetical protein